MNCPICVREKLAVGPKLANGMPAYKDEHDTCEKRLFLSMALWFASGTDRQKTLANILARFLDVNARGGGGEYYTLA